MNIDYESEHSMSFGVFQKLDTPQCKKNIRSKNGIRKNFKQ